MINLITRLDDPLLDYIKDDPVRPEIPREQRVSRTKFVAAYSEDCIQAIVCISLHDFIPQSVDDLEREPEQPTAAIFYTIWSYAPGAGAKLLFAVVEEIKRLFPTITRFVTLSPKTEMARRFHLKNGAHILKENENSVNYEYFAQIENNLVDNKVSLA